MIYCIKKTSVYPIVATEQIDIFEMHLISFLIQTASIFQFAPEFSIWYT